MIQRCYKIDCFFNDNATCTPKAPKCPKLSSEPCTPTSAVLRPSRCASFARTQVSPRRSTPRISSASPRTLLAVSFAQPSWPSSAVTVPSAVIRCLSAASWRKTKKEGRFRRSELCENPRREAIRLPTISTFSPTTATLTMKRRRFPRAWTVIR